jgi:hypothetical protein
MRSCKDPRQMHLHMMAEDQMPHHYAAAAGKLTCPDMLCPATHVKYVIMVSLWKEKSQLLYMNNNIQIGISTYHSFIKLVD